MREALVGIALFTITALALATFTVTSRRLLANECECARADELAGNLSRALEAHSALLAEHAALKQRVAKVVKPTAPPVNPKNLWLASARTWATAASQRAWAEFECVGPEVDGLLSDRHAATAKLWRDLPGDRKCGCLHLVEPVRFSNATCTATSAKRVCDADAPLWIVFAGDSTFRYFFTTLVSALGAKSLAVPTQPSAPDAKQRSLDDETRYLGAVGHDEDMDAQSSAEGMVLSHRVLWGTQAAKLLSILRRPHTHRIKPYYGDPAVTKDHGEMQAQSGALDEPLFVETLSGVPASARRCGPDLVVTGFGFWDIISSVTGGEGTGNVERDRCSLQRAGASLKLFPSRLVTMLNAACELYGPERFLYRTLNRGEIAKGQYPVHALNGPATKLARDMGLPVLDFEAMATARGDARIDETHADTPIVAQALCEVLRFALARLPPEWTRKRNAAREAYRRLTSAVADHRCAAL